MFLCEETECSVPSILVYVPWLTFSVLKIWFLVLPVRAGKIYIAGKIFEFKYPCQFCYTTASDKVFLICFFFNFIDFFHLILV
jgi:hypothetical protein